MKKILNLYKKVGWTPLETIEKFKLKNPVYKNKRMGYAGRLDPMAEGVLIVLVEEENNENFNPERIIDKLDNELPRECSSSPLIQTLRMALWRYAGTRNVQNLSDAVESNMEALAIQQDSENSMIRYLIWAIPSIGFIGTVRGIGQALSMADKALAGDIAGMTDSLGVAFNSTLVALLLSVFLMFLFHELQRLQDSEILDTQAYCDKYLLGKIK